MATPYLQSKALSSQLIEYLSFNTESFLSSFFIFFLLLTLLIALSAISTLKALYRPQTKCAVCILCILHRMGRSQPSMATHIQLKWNNGEKQRRAAQIPGKTWATHKPTIWELYKTKTLAELMDIMKLEHGFEATERQYTHRLAKWGKEEVVTSESATGSIKKQPDEILPSGSELCSDNLKRPMSRQSIDRRISQSSTDPRPPSKRPRVTTVEETNNIDWPETSEESISDFSRSGASEDAQSIISSISFTELTTAQGTSPDTSDSHINFSRPYSSKECLLSSETIGQTVTSDAQCQSSETTVPFASLSLQSESKTPTFAEGQSPSEQPQAPEGPIPPQQVASPVIGNFSRAINLAFCLEISRKLQSFSSLPPGFVLSGQSRGRLTILADRLFAIDHFQAAGNIYSVLLLTEEAELGHRFWPKTGTVLTPMLIAAARSAITFQQRALVQNVLLKRLEWWRDQEQDVGFALRDMGIGSVAETFLAHVFAAECFARQERYSTISYHLDQAQSYLDKVCKLGDHALKPSMSILFYVYYKRVCREKLSLRVPATSSRRRLVAAHVTSQISQNDLLEFCILIRDQEKDEAPTRRRETLLVDRFSSCVRDCVTWCGLTVTDHNLEMYRSSWSIDVFGLAWDVWQHQPSIESSWSMDSENELGISASEHLRICIDLLCSKGIEELSDISNGELLGLYLEAFFERAQHTFGQERSNPGEARNSARASLALTVASSLGSSNASLKNFKSVFQSIKQRVAEFPSRAARGSPYTAPAFRFSQMSEISQLSDMFEVTSIREDDETESV